MTARLLSVFLALVVLAVQVTAADHEIEPILSRIPREPVASRALASIGYSRRLHALEIEFRHGGTYRYLEVSPALHRDFLAANSKARFYNRNIKGRYRAVCVRPQIGEAR